MSPALAWWMWWSVSAMIARDALGCTTAVHAMHEDGALLRKNNKVGPSSNGGTCGDNGRAPFHMCVGYEN